MRGFPTGAHFSTPPIPPPNKPPERLKHSTGTSPTWLHENQTSRGTISGNQAQDPQTGPQEGGGQLPPSQMPQGENGLQKRVKFAASIPSHPFPSTDSPSPRPGGLRRGGGLWDTPHEKDVPPTHPEMATRGCTAPKPEGSPSARCPPTNQREVTGACPIPLAPKAGRIQGQETGGVRGARREPILRLPTIPTQECTKPGRMPKQMPWSREGIC